MRCLNPEGRLSPIIELHSPITGITTRVRSINLGLLWCQSFPHIHPCLIRTSPAILFEARLRSSPLHRSIPQRTDAQYTSI
jgi:hypothetical protein